jgi:hypothetical protein
MASVAIPLRPIYDALSQKIKSKMNTTPLAQDLWDGIAGQFDSISQVLCEFIDNSISNIEAKKIPHKTVYITIDKNSKGKIEFTLLGFNAPTLA